jgi:hypothetical protein
MVPTSFGMLRSVPSTLTLAPMVPSVHPTVRFSCFLASLTCFFASLIVVASMGPRYVYKDMLDNVVSPIACVSMKDQMATREGGGVNRSR